MQYNETAKGMKVLCQSVLLTLLVTVSAHGGPISRDIVPSAFILAGNATSPSA